MPVSRCCFPRPRPAGRRPPRWTIATPAAGPVSGHLADGVSPGWPSGRSRGSATARRKQPPDWDPVSVGDSRAPRGQRRVGDERPVRPAARRLRLRSGGGYPRTTLLFLETCDRAIGNSYTVHDRETIKAEVKTRKSFPSFQCEISHSVDIVWNYGFTGVFAMCACIRHVTRLHLVHPSWLYTCLHHPGNEHNCGCVVAEIQKESPGKTRKERCNTSGFCRQRLTYC